MSIDLLLDSLNPPQRAAVTTDAQHTLVLAGAGSGKTKVLVHRMAFLLQFAGVSPHNLMALTFTNKAAGEMKHRVQSLLQEADVTQLGGLTIGTFHAIALRFLRQHHELAQLPATFQVLDAADQLRLIKRILKENQWDESHYPPKQVASFINNQKEDGKRAGDIDPGYNPFTRQLVVIYQLYQDYCQRSGVVDFAELLLRCHQLFLHHPLLLKQIQQRYSHILVDEFQDTNRLQYAWLRLLTGTQGHLFVVGDDDQSIYSWRGAQVENLQHFSQDFADVNLVRLEQNYRSTATILQAANHVINHNHDRLGKELWTNGDQGSPILIYKGYNEHEEATFIAETVAQWQQAHPLNDVGILYRSNALSRIIENTMIQHQLPYRVYGGLRFYDRAEIKDALAYVRLVVNPDDDTALDRIINVPTRGIGAKTLTRIQSVAQTQQISLWQACTQLIANQDLSAKALGAVTQFVQLIQRLQQTLPLALPQLQMDTILQASGLRDYWQAQQTEQAQTKLENLDELMSACEEFARQQQLDVPTADTRLQALSLYLEEATLNAGDAQADAHEDAVTLMSIHAAKGLEFPLVFMVGMEEGIFPSQLALEEQGDAEERRLAYVGITRAEQQLVLSYTESRLWHGKPKYHQPSRFIGEIPAELVQHLRPNTAIYERSSNLKSIADTNENSSNFVPPFAIGSRVHHDKFGDGLVLNYDHQSDEPSIDIFFDHAGKKTLLLSLAKLSKGS